MSDTMELLIMTVVPSPEPTTSLLVLLEEDEEGSSTVLTLCHRAFESAWLSLLLCAGLFSTLVLLSSYSRSEHRKEPQVLEAVLVSDRHDETVTTAALKR